MADKGYYTKRLYNDIMDVFNSDRILSGLAPRKIILSIISACFMGNSKQNNTEKKSRYKK